MACFWFSPARGGLERDALISNQAAAQPVSIVILTIRYLIRVGRSSDAIVLLRKTQRQRPGDLWINLHLSEVLSDEDRRDVSAQSIGFARAAVALQPDSALVHNNLARILQFHNQLDEAAQEFLRTIQLDPDNLTARWELAYFYRRSKEWRKALDVYEGSHLTLAHPLVERSTAFNMCIEYISYLCDCPERRFRDPGRAVELATSITTAMPTSYEGLRARGWAHYRAGRLPLSIQSLTKAAEFNDKDAETWQMLGEVNYRAGQWKPSIVASQRAFASQKTAWRLSKIKMVRCLFFMAMAQSQIQDWAKAHNSYSDAQKRKSDSKEFDEEMRNLSAEAEVLIQTAPIDAKQ